MSCKFFIKLASIALALTTPAFGTITYVGSQAGLGADSSANWSQLGVDGTILGQNFSATSSGGLTINGSFATSGGGVLAIVGTDWNPVATGFNNGDSVIVAEDGTGIGSGPLTLLLTHTINDLGLYIQITGSATYTAQIQALGSGGAVLSTFGGKTSDASGNPLFLGVADSTPGELFGIKVSITSCTSLTISPCSSTDFAADRLFITSGTPEPSGWLLMGTGLALGWVGRWRLKVNRRNS